MEPRLEAQVLDEVEGLGLEVGVVCATGLPISGTSNATGSNARPIANRRLQHHARAA